MTPEDFKKWIIERLFVANDDLPSVKVIDVEQVKYLYNLLSKEISEKDGEIENTKKHIHALELKLKLQTR